VKLHIHAQGLQQGAKGEVVTFSPPPPFALLSYAYAQLNRLHTNVAMVL